MQDITDRDGSSTPIQIYREQNIVANRLAKKDTSIQFTEVPIITTMPTPFVLSYLLDDCSGKTFDRIVKKSNLGHYMTIVNSFSYPQGRDVDLNNSILAASS